MSDRNKSPLKISRKETVGILRDCRQFSGHSYVGASCSHLCGSSAFFCGFTIKGKSR